jgi:hypothetical protein
MKVSVCKNTTRRKRQGGAIIELIMTGDRLNMEKVEKNLGCFNAILPETRWILFNNNKPG